MRFEKERGGLAICNSFFLGNMFSGEVADIDQGPGRPMTPSTTFPGVRTWLLGAQFKADESPQPGRRTHWSKLLVRKASNLAVCIACPAETRICITGTSQGGLRGGFNSGAQARVQLHM